VTQRALPVLFSVLGLWAVGDPLPVIGMGKERARSGRAKSFAKKGPRRSGGKEPESEFEALKRRLEDAMSQCCEGVYEWVALDVIRECAEPFRETDGSSATSTPTPTVATVTVSGEAEGSADADPEAPSVDGKRYLLCIIHHLTLRTEEESASRSKKESEPITTPNSSSALHLKSLGALRLLHLQLRQRLHSYLISSYVHNLGALSGEDGWTQSGGFAGIDEADVEMMRLVYAREAVNGSEEDKDEEDEGEGAWEVGVCRGWLAQVVEKWVDLPGARLLLSLK
jgi:hypothetical protein